jgi:hypothetical protein
MYLSASYWQVVEATLDNDTAQYSHHLATWTRPDKPIKRARYSTQGSLFACSVSYFYFILFYFIFVRRPCEFSRQLLAFQPARNFRLGNTPLL